MSLNQISGFKVKQNKGFTLIEVLIAMTLLSIMVVLLFTSLKICAQSWEQGEKKMSDVNEVAAVYNFFQRHLPSATPLWNDFSKADERTFSFQGKKQSLEFVSTFPASAGKSGMQLFSLDLVQKNNEKIINVTITPFFPVTDGEEWKKEEAILLRHVEDFSLSYFGPAEEGANSIWQDEWLTKNSQPQLIKIIINTKNGIYWPEMIIELKVAATVNTDELGGSNMNQSSVVGNGN
ncbi:MAG: prepilin-type N-terminal cleavage/methylation domain-containing protein [Methylobacter sp.]|nr:prepilin-type N-terminal cleavage/methylation domain-containing protein [Methylobacter sp.]